MKSLKDMKPANDFYGYKNMALLTKEIRGLLTLKLDAAKFLDHVSSRRR